HSALVADKAEKVTGGVIVVTDDPSGFIDATGLAGVAAASAEVNYLAVAKETRVLLSTGMLGHADNVTGIIQCVGDTVIGAKLAERDHLTAGVENPAIGAIGKSRVTGDLPGGVDPAPQGRFATECTDIDHLTIALKKGRVAHLTRRRAGCSRHLATVIDALGDAEITVSA